MNEQQSKQIISKSTMSTNTNTADASVTMQSPRYVAQNYLILWVNENIDLASKDYQNTRKQLQRIANEVYTFTQRDECVDFLTEIDDRKAYLIVPDTIGQQMVSLIHGIPQLDSIYINCSSKAPQEDWSSHWNKVKGVYTEIPLMCEALQMAVKQ
ncbi:unnamed protein product, partial [Rotaria sp. Silwood2]